MTLLERCIHCFAAWSHTHPCQAPGLGVFNANVIAFQVDVPDRLVDFQFFGKGLWTKTMATNSWTQLTTFALICRNRGLKTIFQSHSEPSKGNKWGCAFDLTNEKVCHNMSWHERQARAGTICELERDYRELRTTYNTALAMKRSLAPSRACSSRLSTLLIANACCSPTVYYSFVLQHCACCRENQ